MCATATMNYAYIYEYHTSTMGVLPTSQVKMIRIACIYLKNSRAKQEVRGAVLGGHSCDGCKRHARSHIQTVLYVCVGKANRTVCSDLIPQSHYSLYWSTTCFVGTS